MISKNKLKYLRSLSLKKHRTAEGVFLAEGAKAVGDLLPLLPCTLLCGTEAYLENNAAFKAFEQGGGVSAAGRPAGNSREANAEACEIITINQQELEQASQLRAPRDVIAVFKMPVAPPPAPDLPLTELCLALDEVQDPGNLGTIIRIADWFGITHLLLSAGTADAFAPKVVQATMGAIGRVRLHEVDLPLYLRSLPAGAPVYGTFLDGDNIYASTLRPHGVIVMGNEGSGISAAVASCINSRLFVPNFPAGRPTSESLNVAVATAVVCAEFRRRGSGI